MVGNQNIPRIWVIIMTDDVLKKVIICNPYYKPERYLKYTGGNYVETKM